jgi:hypothetical protein
VVILDFGLARESQSLEEQQKEEAQLRSMLCGDMSLGDMSDGDTYDAMLHRNTGLAEEQQTAAPVLR